MIAIGERIVHEMMKEVIQYANWNGRKAVLLFIGDKKAETKRRKMHGEVKEGNKEGNKETRKERGRKREKEGT